MSDRCKFSVKIKGGIADVLKEVKKEAARHDVEVRGDTKKGSLRHKKVDIKGTYVVEAKKVALDIVEDTMWADCKKIESSVKKWFKNK